jgi:hypothetical protein
VSRYVAYLEAVADWQTAVERFACTAEGCEHMSGELLDSITGDLLDDHEEMHMLRSLSDA